MGEGPRPIFGVSVAGDDMDALLSTGYAAANAASQQQDRLLRLIVAAGQNPTPESISDVEQAQVLSEMATRVEAKVLSVAKQAGEDLVDLMGQGLDTYA